MFHASIGEAHGIKIERGQPGPLAGVIGGAKGTVYYHKVKLIVGSEMIAISAGFSHELSIAGLLGRHGFFENFVVTFDPCSNPPGLEVSRIHRT